MDRKAASRKKSKSGKSPFFFGEFCPTYYLSGSVPRLGVGLRGTYRGVLLPSGLAWWLFASGPLKQKDARRECCRHHVGLKFF